MTLLAELAALLLCSAGAAILGWIEGRNGERRRAVAYWYRQEQQRERDNAARAKAARKRDLSVN